MEKINRNFQVSPETAPKIKKYAEMLDCSGNQFVDRAVAALCEMIESEAKLRTVPKIVLKIDALKRLESPPSLYPTGNERSIPLALNESKISKRQ